MSASCGRNMMAYLAFQLRSAPEGVAVVDLDKRVMDSQTSKEALAGTIRELRATHANDLESLALCMDTYTNTKNTPEAYLKMVVDGVIRCSDLPTRYRQDAISVRYIHTPEYKETQSWLVRFPYFVKNDTVTWGDPDWMLCGDNASIEGIFGDL